MKNSDIKDELIFKSLMNKSGLEEPPESLHDEIMKEIILNPLKIPHRYKPVISKKFFVYLAIGFLGIFIPLIIFLSRLTPEVKSHLKNSSIFDNLFSTISNFIPHIHWTIPIPLPLAVLVIFILVFLDSKIREWFSINRH
ncbi:MAG: hypothetical protein ABSG15_05135 [FCB group bacterium]|jgi:hypothetical protein